MSRLLEVENNHSQYECPLYKVDAKSNPDARTFYFENALGEQAIIVFDPDRDRVTLSMGDMEWEECNLEDGGIVSSPAEQAWTEACMMVINKLRGMIKSRG